MTAAFLNRESRMTPAAQEAQGIGQRRIYAKFRPRAEYTAPLFTPFRWHESPDEAGTIDTRDALRVIGHAKDVASGLRVVLGLVEDEHLRAVGKEQPLLGGDAIPLMRLAITACDLLDSEAGQFIGGIPASASAANKGGAQ